MFNYICTVTLHDVIQLLYGKKNTFGNGVSSSVCHSGNRKVIEKTMIVFAFFCLYFIAFFKQTFV